MEAERLLVTDTSPSQAAALVESLPILDALVRDGDLRGAARRADDILALDHDRLWAAYLAYRGRRLGRRRTRPFTGA